MTRLLVNLTASEAGWLACVLGAANGMPWAGPLVVLALVAIHLRWSKRPGPELGLVLSAVLIGLVADSALVIAGLVTYPSGVWIEGFAPYWILAMWAMFATTLNVSMKWLRNRNVLAAAFGAVGGPLAYLAGQELGAISFTQPTLAIIALAIIWAVSMPLLMALAIRLDGVSEQRPPDFILRDWREARQPQATRRTPLVESGLASDPKGAMHSLHAVEYSRLPPQAGAGKKRDSFNA